MIHGKESHKAAKEINGQRDSRSNRKDKRETTDVKP